MKDPYHCPYCDQRSTRRWNLDVHIKRKHGEYLLGGSSDRYIDSNTRLYSNSVQLGHATVDSIDNSFHPTFLPKEAVLGTSQYSANPTYPPVDVSQTFANPMYRPMQIMNDQSYGTNLSPETILKIAEQRLLFCATCSASSNVVWSSINAINHFGFPITLTYNLSAAIFEVIFSRYAFIRPTCR
jgi:hypothetical protein